MKKKTKITLATIITLIILPTSVFAAMNWRGSDNVDNIKTNLTLISQKMDDLSNDSVDKDKTIKEVQELLKQQENLVKQKDDELNGKQKEIENKQKEIQQKIDEMNEKNKVVDQKNVEINTKEQELQQALEDVREIERLTEEMVR